MDQTLLTVLGVVIAVPIAYLIPCSLLVWLSGWSQLRRRYGVAHPGQGRTARQSGHKLGFASGVLVPFRALDERRMLWIFCGPVQGKSLGLDGVEFVSAGGYYPVVSEEFKNWRVLHGPGSLRHFPRQLYRVGSRLVLVGEKKQPAVELDLARATYAASHPKGLVETATLPLSRRSRAARSFTSAPAPCVCRRAHSIRDVTV